MGGDKGRTERGGSGLRDDGDARVHVVLGGVAAPFRAAAVALIGGSVRGLFGFGRQCFCPWISDEFSNALDFCR